MDEQEPAGRIMLAFVQIEGLGFVNCLHKAKDLKEITAKGGRWRNWLHEEVAPQEPLWRGNLKKPSKKKYNRNCDS